jgi:Flp pilus assembly CpaE family ATPase
MLPGRSLNLIVTPEIDSLKSTTRFREFIERIGIFSEKIKLILNRYESKDGFDERQQKYIHDHAIIQPFFSGVYQTEC